MPKKEKKKKYLETQHASSSFPVIAAAAIPAAATVPAGVDEGSGDGRVDSGHCGK